MERSRTRILNVYAAAITVTSLISDEGMILIWAAQGPREQGKTDSGVRTSNEASRVCGNLSA